jgi:hypothetical protein
MRLNLNRLFRRRKAGGSIVVLIFGVFACLSGLTATLMGAPLAWWRAREAARLPRPTVAELETLPPGTDALFTGWVPASDFDLNLPHGLVLYKVERAAETEGTATPGPSATWVLETPPQDRIRFQLTEDDAVTLQLPEDVSFANAHVSFANAHVFETQEDGVTRRYTGYLPDQTLTVEGTWERPNLVTARALTAGPPDAYVAHLRRQPGQLAVGGAVCGGMGFVLLVVAAGLRLLGK